MLMPPILTKGLGLPSVLPIMESKIKENRKGRKFEKNLCLYGNGNLNQGQTAND